MQNSDKKAVLAVVDWSCFAPNTMTDTKQPRLWIRVGSNRNVSFLDHSQAEDLVAYLCWKAKKVLFVLDAVVITL